MYEENKACIRLSPVISTDWFNVTTGVHQGDPLSPTLLNLFINDLIVYIKSLHLGVNIGDSLCISILLYADDIILLAQTEGDLQIILNGLNDWCNNWKLRVNLKKSNIIHFISGRRKCKKLNINFSLIMKKC